jgi:tryptophanyl-tRNA synthetase
MKRMVSGIKPTGRVQLGNYLGAIKPFVNYQEEYEMFIFIANLHSMTIYQEPKELKKNTRDLLALYISAGLDPKKVNFFLQSDILAHSQLGWYLTCISSMGELNRMTQYKDKLAKNEVIGTGVFVYPTLMASDILIYNPEYVPVGDDQKQHVELTRNLAERFNNRYSDTFIVPEPVIKKVGSRIMDLQNPTQKMSKSTSNQKGCIFILDDINVSKKKIMSAITDSDNIIKYDIKNKPGISNLLEIYATLKNISISELEIKYQGIGYGVFKKDLAEIVGEELLMIQKRYNEVIKGDYIDRILDEGSQVANKIAFKTLKKVERKIGIDIRKRR